MRTPLVLAATLAAGLTPAPAHAAPVRAHCAYVAAAQSAVTGSAESFAGFAFGYAAFDDLGPHTLRCYVTVNGVEQVPGTLTGAGNVVVPTAGPVGYQAAEADTVELCAEVDATFPTHETVCEPVTETQLPPPEVVDLVDDVLAPIWDVMSQIDFYYDPMLCPVFASLAPGVPGVVDISYEGDVTIVGVGPFWDCPPYGNLFPPDGPPSNALRIQAVAP
jgi:hypothetical protein